MIADRIRRQIVDGELPAGSRLPRQEALAEEFGVSHAVIREALRMLEAQNLVTVHRGKVGGATVQAPDAGTLEWQLLAILNRGHIPVDDVQATIAALDSISARIAAARRNRRQVMAALQSSLKIQADLVNDHGAFATECHRFHDLIAQSTGLYTLPLIIEATNAAAASMSPPGARECERIASRGLSATQRVVEEHRRLVDAVRSGDACLAADVAAHG
jgi:DNA-binding FadR family transcriptional regulator